ncbi:hypothetical protein D8S78_18980 [Natrialba swarupiae]|nr:hypothetical protein [Natrialba swarupiae]
MPQPTALSRLFPARDGDRQTCAAIPLIQLLSAIFSDRYPVSLAHATISAIIAAGPANSKIAATTILSHMRSSLSERVI